MAMPPSRANVAQRESYVTLRTPKGFSPANTQQQQHEQELIDDDPAPEGFIHIQRPSSRIEVNSSLNFRAPEFKPSSQSQVSAQQETVPEYFEDNRKRRAGSSNLQHRLDYPHQRQLQLQQQQQLEEQNQQQQSQQRAYNESQQTNYYAGCGNYHQPQPYSSRSYNHHNKTDISQRLKPNGAQHTTFYANNAAYANDVNNVAQMTEHLSINNSMAAHQHQQQQHYESSYANSVPSRYNYIKRGGGGGGGGGSGGYGNGFAMAEQNGSDGTGGSGDGRYLKRDSLTVNEMENVALNYLKTAINRLSDNPGIFDHVANQLITLFEGFESNDYVICNSMEEIFNASITNSNFRYMGAKLYNLLHMLNLSKDSMFLSMLDLKLSDTCKEMENLQPGKDDKSRETTLFLAELYMQLREDDNRLQLLANYLVIMLLKLVNNLNIENVRCICLTLKLAGYDLSVDCVKEMSTIMKLLEQMMETNDGSQQYLLVERVLQMSKENWGRKASVGSIDATQAVDGDELRASDDPVFYGPDGRELTAEENDFLNNDAIQVGGGDEEDNAEDIDLDLVDLDPEMDEESEQAYMEFLKQNAAHNG